MNHTWAMFNSYVTNYRRLVDGLNPAMCRVFSEKNMIQIPFDTVWYYKPKWSCNGSNPVFILQYGKLYIVSISKYYKVLQYSIYYEIIHIYIYITYTYIDIYRLWQTPPLLAADQAINEIGRGKGGTSAIPWIRIRRIRCHQTWQAGKSTRFMGVQWENHLENPMLL